tara:strand:+ start:1368 stop:2732 length:1365 start_codon:yes stop_codon:yes gene_type:complete
MAELKVDKILPATGSSIALSESGKTVTIPSGATLDASAATLSGIGARVDYCTSVQSSPFTAAAGKGYFINTGSAVTVTLPSSPSAGDEIIVIDSTGQAATNNITLGRNTNKIKGLCADATLKTDRVGVRIIYSGSSQGWVTVTSANETPPVLDQTLYVTATGGTVTTSGDFKIHTFNSDANFVVSCAGTSSGSNKVSYMVVAGGGGGGSGYGGGGGAGGFREGKCSSDPYTDSPLDSGVGLSVPATTYPITVGAGGTGATHPASGGSGNNSIFSTITSAGGGGGGKEGGTNGANGGSGAGGGAPGGTGGTGNTPPVSPPQGNDGGDGVGAPSYQGGGGGGASAVGADGVAPNASGGTGGNGITTSINASPVTRAGGGGGSHYPTPSAPSSGAAGGSGGGGQGGSVGPNPFTAGAAGTTNTGSGGGGGGFNPGTGHQPAGAGGSGVVIIRYKFQN